MRYRVHSALIYDRCGGCQQRTSCGTTWFLKVQYRRSVMRTRRIIARFLRVHENTITTGYAIATRLGQLQAPSLEVGI